MAGIASTFAQTGACHDLMSTTGMSIFLTRRYEDPTGGSPEWTRYQSRLGQRVDRYAATWYWRY
jgi:hypothetical protein